MSHLLWMPLHAQSNDADQQSVDAHLVHVVVQPLEGVRQGRLLDFTFSAWRKGSLSACKVFLKDSIGLPHYYSNGDNHNCLLCLSAQAKASNELQTLYSN